LRRAALCLPRLFAANPLFSNRAGMRFFYDLRASTTAFAARFPSFRGKSTQAPVREQFTLKSGFFPAKPESNPVKPSQTIFLL
jgi:hypothetical protein